MRAHSLWLARGNASEIKIDTILYWEDTPQLAAWYASNSDSPANEERDSGMYQRPKPDIKIVSTDTHGSSRTTSTTMAIAILWLVIWHTAIPARAEQPTEPQTVPSQETLSVEADRFSLDIHKNESTANGNVTLYYRNMQLNADEVRYDKKNLKAWAMGNVKLVSGKDLLSGDQLTLDMDRETGILENGFVFMDQNHMYLKADEIQKTGPNTYTASRATITTCDGPKPDWRFTGKDLEITVEGYGTARHAAFWAGRVPLLYTPYLVFPVKTNRQSGLLMPELTFSSRNGFQYLQPLFWAINTSHDATFNAEYISSRGLRLGAEYRYALGSDTFGAAMIDGLNDQQIDDGMGSNSEDWGYPDDTYLRTNSARYWLRAKFNQPLAWDIQAKLDLDLVSDQDYLYEFRDGGLGFYQSRRYFRETFGRDLDDELNNVRLNQLNLNKTWHLYSANGDLRWYDDAVKGQQGEPQDAVQHLPALSFNAIAQQAGALPIFYAFDAHYDHLFRIDGDRGHRADFRAEIAYPIYMFKVLSVVPSAGLRQTFWHLDQADPVSDLQADQFHRSLYDLKLNIYSDLFRVYEASSNDQSPLQHIIRPELDYEYVSPSDQSDLPEFDYRDRIEAKNVMTYALTNTWFKRRVEPTSPEQQGLDKNLEIRFKLQQSFDVEKLQNDDPEPFSDLLGELDLDPGQYLHIDMDATWSPYDNAINNLTTGGYLKNTREDRLDLNYRFTRTTEEVQGTQTLRLAARWNLTDHWQLRGSHEHNIESDEVIETVLGFSYHPQCWALDVDYREEEHDRSIAVKVRLLGL